MADFYQSLEFTEGAVYRREQCYQVAESIEPLAEKRLVDNTISFDDYNREKNRITEGVMLVLKEQF